MDTNCTFHFIPIFRIREKDLQPHTKQFRQVRESSINYLNLISINISIAPLECGGTFVLPKGKITSPNYPNNFERNTYCEWLLKTEPSHTMTLKFTDFDFESSPNCSVNSVKV